MPVYPGGGIAMPGCAMAGAEPQPGALPPPHALPPEPEAGITGTLGVGVGVGVGVGAYGTAEGDTKPPRSTAGGCTTYTTVGSLGSTYACRSRMKAVTAETDSKNALRAAASASLYRSMILKKKSRNVCAPRHATPCHATRVRLTHAASGMWTRGGQVVPGAMDRARIVV